MQVMLRQLSTDPVVLLDKIDNDKPLSLSGSEEDPIQCAELSMKFIGIHNEMWSDFDEIFADSFFQAKLTEAKKYWTF